MSKSKPSPVTSICAVMAIVATILVIGAHHADPTDIWSSKSVHITVDVLAVAFMACPFISWYFFD